MTAVQLTVDTVQLDTICTNINKHQQTLQISHI